MILKQLLDLIIDLSLDRGYKHRNLLNDCVELIEWIQTHPTYQDIILKEKKNYIKYARIYFE